MNLLCVQEQNIPGTSLEEKWQTAQEWGFTGIELRGKGDGHFTSRLPELRQAARAGVIMPVVCVDMLHFVGDFDAAKRADAITQMREQLTVIAEIGGHGAITPASYGMFSDRLPPFVSPRSAEEDHAILMDGFGALAEHAHREGVSILIEPLNRYENHMIRTLGDAVRLIEAVGSPAFKIAADTYHMNIEEADLSQAFRDAAPHLGHIQPSDSNRLEPGAGHLDWAELFGTLTELGYRGDFGIESRLSGPAATALTASATLLNRFLPLGAPA